jgi:hypothetical protein
MSPTPDFSADLTMFDGRQTVTVEVPDAEPFMTDALKRPVTLREMELSGGLYQPGDVRWHFAAPSLAAEPIVGTLISESGGCVWSVIDSQATVFGGRQTCTARLVAGGGG